MHGFETCDPVIWLSLESPVAQSPGECTLEATLLRPGFHPWHTYAVPMHTSTWYIVTPCTHLVPRTADMHYLTSLHLR